MVTHGNQRLLGITHDVLEGHMWMDGDSTLKDPIFTKGVHLVWVYVYGYHGDPWCLGQGTMVTHGMGWLPCIIHDPLIVLPWMDGDSTLKDPIFTKGVHLGGCMCMGAKVNHWLWGLGGMASLAMCMCI